MWAALTRRARWSADGSTVTVPVGSDAGVQAGQLYVIRHVSRQVLMRMEAFGQVTVEHVRVYGTRGFSLLAAECGNVTYSDVKQILREPSRVMTVAADTFNIPQCNGHIVVRNCEAERMGDDAMNIHTEWRQIFSIAADRRSAQCVNQAQVKSDFLPTAPGVFVPVAVYERATFAPLFATSASVTRDGQYAFADALPAAVKAWDLVARVSDTVPQSVLVEGSSFHDSRGRGLRVKANNVVLRNNNIARTLGAAVWVHTDLIYDYEGYFVNNFTIQNNTIDACIRGLGPTSGGGFDDPAHITIDAWLTKRFQPDGTPIVGEGTRVSGGATLHKNMRILDNTITARGTNERHVLANAVGTIAVSGNTFISPAAAQANMEFASCANIDVQSNTCLVNGATQTCVQVQT